MSSQKNKNNWSVYIIEACDGSFYTGITTDTERRFSEHLNGKKGAKYFNGKTPLRILFNEKNHDRSSASKQEARIKSMTRAQKKTLIDAAQYSPNQPE